MQYIEVENKDITPGYETYCLQYHKDGFEFRTYTGDTLNNLIQKNKEQNLSKGRYFLRKGFSRALDADPNVIEPVFVDKEGNEVKPKSKDEAIDLIYSDKLGISGFKFVEGATEEQKNNAASDIISAFASASQNLDFASDKKVFIVQGNRREVAYANDGKENFDLAYEIQEKIGIKTLALEGWQIKKQRKKLASQQTASNVAENKEAILERLYQAKGKRDASPIPDSDFKIVTGTQYRVQHAYILPMQRDRNKELEMVDQFLSAGYDANMDICDGNRLLHYVENIESLKKLYEHGADVNATNNDGQTALFYPESTEKTQFLLDHGVNVNAIDSGGHTALATCSTVEQAQLLLNHGADPLIVNNYGRDMIDCLEEQNGLFCGEDENGKPIYEYSDEDKKIIALVKDKARNMKLAQVRANAKKHDNNISGVVVADKIAEGMISGVIAEPVTPKKGKEMSNSVKKAYFQRLKNMQR